MGFGIFYCGSTEIFLFFSFRILKYGMYCIFIGDMWCWDWSPGCSSGIGNLFFFLLIIMSWNILLWLCLDDKIYDELKINLWFPCALTMLYSGYAVWVCTKCLFLLGSIVFVSFIHRLLGIAICYLLETGC